MNEGVGAQQLHMIHAKMQVSLFFFSKLKMLGPDSQNHLISPMGGNAAVGERQADITGDFNGSAVRAQAATGRRGCLMEKCNIINIFPIF